MPRCRGRANLAAELHGDCLAPLTTARAQNTTHMSHYTRCNKIKTSALLSVNGVYVCAFGEERSWKQMSSLCPDTCMHTCTHAAAKHRIELPSRHSSSPPSLCGPSEVGNRTWSSTGTHFPNLFYWNSPAEPERSHTDILAPVPPAPSIPM